MKSLLLLCLLSASPALAWPGMSKTALELKSKLAARQDADGAGPDDGNEGNDSFELLGDLRADKTGPVTPVGTIIAGILGGTVAGQNTTAYQGDPFGINTAKCKADTCCVWRHVSLKMENKFRGKTGRCNKWARAAIRLGFHDAGTWSKFTDDHGGADGSIILANELGRGENNGLQEIAAIVQDWYTKFHPYGVGMADLIQMAANVATVVCPLGPRVRTFVGRIDSSVPSVNGLLPDVFADADSLIKLFQDKTINAHGLTALVGAHTTSQQHFVNVSRAGDPQDSSPGVWDITFYSQTTGTAPKRVFKFPSDVKLSVHPSVSTEWNHFATEQEHWNEDYSREYVRLSLLGVNNINKRKYRTELDLLSV
jgi:catalase (peroxidase I)